VLSEDETMKRIAVILALFTLAASYSAWAQNTQSTQSTTNSPDQPSLGDYARRVHKDPAVKARPKVFDNDNIPSDEKVSVVGAPASPEADAKSSDNNDGDKAAGASDSDQSKKQAEWKTWQDKLTTQKNSIDLAARELDVLQKEYQMRAAQMYADVGNRLRNSAEWDKEDADYKQKIADKQKEVEDAKQKLEDMQEEARKAGVPAAMRDPQG
jgi:hypothetical protein